MQHFLRTINFEDQKRQDVNFSLKAICLVKRLQGNNQNRFKYSSIHEGNYIERRQN